MPSSKPTQSIFKCLVSKDTKILKEASASVSSSSVYGTWAFLPVTDGRFIQKSPSDALLTKKLNGINHLSGSNAEESFYFTDTNIKTTKDLETWARLVFPLFTDKDIKALLSQYPTSKDTNLPRFASAGDSGPSANDVSQVATGVQQTAFNIYAETTFVCPSYWLAEAYSGPSAQKYAGYKYQFSVVNAAHGADSYAAFGYDVPNISPDFTKAFQRIWGNFIRTGNPSLKSSVLGDWPRFVGKPGAYQLVNLNQTGGTEIQVPAYVGWDPVNVTVYTGEGRKNDFRVVNGYTWEAGRGKRCEWLRSVAARAGK